MDSDHQDSPGVVLSCTDMQTNFSGMTTNVTDDKIIHFSISFILYFSHHVPQATSVYNQYTLVPIPSLG